MLKKNDNIIQLLLKVTTPKEYKSAWFRQMLNNFVNFEIFFAKLSWIDPYEKHIDYLSGHAWGPIFMACSKLEAMAIYLVKQA